MPQPPSARRSQDLAGLPDLVGYRIRREIGRGPLTVVYEAVQHPQALPTRAPGEPAGRALANGHPLTVAVRILHPRLAADEAFAERFVRAASQASQLTAPCLPTIFDVGTSHGLCYLAETLLTTPALTTEFAAGAFERAIALRLGQHVAQEAAKIHRAGQVHGHLHPANVFPDAAQLRLTGPLLPWPDLIGPGPHLPYLAPEVLSGAAPDVAADVYGVGALVAGACIGGLPWAGRDGAASTRGLPWELPGLDEDDPLREVLRRACARDPAARYARLDYLREDLERLAHGFAPMHVRSGTASGIGAGVRRSTASHAQGEPVPPVATTRTAPSSRRWLVAACGLVIALGLGLSYWKTNARTPSGTTAAAGTPAAAPSATGTPAAPPEAAPAWAVSAGRDAYGRWADLRVGDAVQRLRLIAPSSFWMGSPADDPERAPDEDHHLVTLSRGYWIGDSEVTRHFHAAVMRSASAAVPAAATTADGDLPVTDLTHAQTQQFLVRLHEWTRAPVRLPTEAEWECAARAGGRPAPASTSAETIAPVRSRPPSAWGLHDLEGNVLEWVEDSYARYPQQHVTDPIAQGGIHRVARGGAWPLPMAAARPAVRHRFLSVAHFAHLGIRLAVSAGPDDR